MESAEFLEEIGLTKNESKAYITLLKFGKLGAGEVSVKGDVPYSRVYDILSGLEEKGLIKEIPEKTRKFVPSDPNEFCRILDEKKKKLENAKKEVDKLKGFYKDRDKNPVIMQFGVKGFHKILSELKEIDKTHYIVKWKSEFRPGWAGRTERSIKKGLDIKTLARYDKVTKSEVDKWLKINKNIKKFSNEGVAMSIADDEEVLISLVKSNVTLLIKDKPFAKIMKKMFLASYDGADLID